MTGASDDHKPQNHNQQPTTHQKRNKPVHLNPSSQCCSISISTSSVCVLVVPHRILPSFPHLIAYTLNSEKMPPSSTKKRVSYAAAPQNSLPAYTPDAYSSDEDQQFNHADNDPGQGWTNGQIPPQFTPAVTLHPYTRSGRLALYGHHRRWINFQSSWSRIGSNASSLDAVHAQSSKGESIMETCPVEEGRTVKALVAQLCERFYNQGWATGTGGGVSIRVGGTEEGRPFRVFVAPSGEKA